jgi:hypothetical protein
MKSPIFFLSRLFLILTLFHQPITASGENALELRNSEMASLSSEREKFYQSLAEAWAPLLFADGSIQQIEVLDEKGNKQIAEILHPADAVVSPFFDGDEDWGNNPAHILETVKDEQGRERSKYHLKAQLLFSVIETKTNYYIAYTKYEALDIGPGAHGQDSEVIWTVVRKVDGKPMGVLDFVATNAHGFARIYSPDARHEEKLREAQVVLMSDKNKLIGEQTYIFDKFAFVHHKFGRPEFLQSEDGENRGLKVFVCRGGHALYKCSTEKWKGRFGKGYIYTCVPVSKEGETQCYPIRAEDQRIVGYSLINMDKMLLELYPQNEASLSDSERSTLEARRSKLFEGHQNRDLTAEVFDGELRLRPSLPVEIRRGPGDQKAEANLSNDWGLKTSYNLALPHLIHRAFDRENKEKISDEYLFNPYVEYHRMNLESKKPTAALKSGFVSPALCLRKPSSSEWTLLRSILKPRI